MIKLHNTLTRRVDELRPLKAGHIGLYSCGPTVYDRVHIGNLSSFIYADLLRRSIAANGYAVQHVMNFTDVDDKTIKRSREQYPELDPSEALAMLTEEYGRAFLNDMAAVGNDITALEFVKATESIGAMQELIRRLKADGYAYVAEDGVYFSIETYKRNGKQYGQLTDITDSSTSEARIQNDEYDKASAHDFALWKKQKGNEPAWDFKLDGQNLKGRPGWHIECSAMSTQALGQPFDIHTGGVDLIFPHHENEIAQSTAGQDDPLYAKLFFHNEHLLVDGQKMSKSLDNFFALQDIIDKGFEPLAFRLLVLQSHYRSQAHFSWDNLAAAQNRLQSFQAMAVLRWQANDQPGQGKAGFADSLDQIKAHLANDLNTPMALVELSSLADKLTDKGVSKADLTDFQQCLAQLDTWLGLGLSQLPDIGDDQKRLIAEREQARQSQDWGRSDQLRVQLAAGGLGLRDTPAGAIWFRS